MSERDAELKAERPEQPRRAGGGTAEGTGAARQADAASTEHTGQPLVVTMEEVLNRENMLKAYHRVVGNRGAPGIDGVTVEQLGDLVRERWEAIREELLSDTYVPSPVRASGCWRRSRVSCGRVCVWWSIERKVPWTGRGNGSFWGTRSPGTSSRS